MTPTASPAASIDLYFLDARHKLIEIAAFLDRVERARARDGDGGDDDFRLRAFRRALAIAADAEGDKARRMQLTFSDPTTEPLESAAGLKGAAGAHPSGGRA
jgi:hypothetical protein